MSRRRAAALTFVGTGSNTLLVSVQAIVLIPLYLRAIGSETYGSWLATGDVLVWLQAFDLGLPNYVIQRVGRAHALGDSQDAARHFATALLVLGSLGCLFALAAFAGAPALARAVKVNASDFHMFVSCFRVAAIATSFLLINNAVVGYSRGVQDVGMLSAATVAGSAVGLTVSLVAVLSGWKLWAIAFGTAARALVVIAASLWFVSQRYAKSLRGSFTPSKQVAADFLRVTPATAVGGISYSLTTQSENFLIALLLGPQVVSVYSLTKKAADMAKGLLETIGYASYGPFAHLVASDQKHRAPAVYAEICDTRFVVAVAAIAGYVAVNQSLMELWVGERFYGGLLLTTLIALQTITTGQAYLTNYLYRATGHIAKGSAALVAEGLVKIALMLLLLRLVGLAGIPVAALVTSLAAMFFYDRWLKNELGQLKERHRTSLRLLVLSVLIVGAAAAAAAYVSLDSWFAVIAVGTIGFSTSLALLVAADPFVVSLRGAIKRVIEARAVFARGSTRRGG